MALLAYSNPKGGTFVKPSPQTLSRFTRCWVSSALATFGLAQIVYSQTLDAFNPSPDGAVYALALQPDGKVLVGGNFNSLCGELRIHIGRLNADGTLDAMFNPGADGSVGALAVQADGSILVAGSFCTLGGKTHTKLARLNRGGVLDSTFNPDVTNYGYTDFTNNSSVVNCLALQADGKILVGGSFIALNGQLRTNIGRFNADGTLDSTFSPATSGSVNSIALQADGKILVGDSFGTRRLNPDGTPDNSLEVGVGGVRYPTVYSLAVQADGKILVGGDFATLGREARANIGRINADGTVDPTFSPGVDASVFSMAVQADGKILVVGAFDSIGGQPHLCVGRINLDGSVDPTFSQGPNGVTYSVAVQADGKVLLGGYFGGMAGQNRSCFGRLNNTEPATQSLVVNGSTIAWLRGGTSPEAWRTGFAVSTNGADWIELGAGTRVSGGWQLIAAAIPPGAAVRAQGFVTGGAGNGSCWFVESTRPATHVDGLRSGRFGLNIIGSAGQVVVVECSTNLLDWISLETNTFGSGPWYFSDPGSANLAWRFYRARLQ